MRECILDYATVMFRISVLQRMPLLFLLRITGNQTLLKKKIDS
jgi:hypothetical protein